MGTVPDQPRSCFKDRGILTELALLGFGHGLPAPGPLGSKLNRKKYKNVMFLCVQSRQSASRRPNIPGAGFALHVNSRHAGTEGVGWRSHAAAVVLQR